MTSHDFWTVLIACACNLACCWLGCYLLLRRMSLLGDAISHAVLPGLAIAFVLSGQRQGWSIFAAAAVMSLVTTTFIQWVHQSARVSEDASIGVVFPALFALGVILITRVAAHVDLDPQCVLYGVLEIASLDTVALGAFEMPRVLITLSIALCMAMVFIVLCWKELAITSFDPALATTMGIPAGLIQYLLMIHVGMVTVASFEAVGSILVIAMLIVPAATAHLLTDRLKYMLLIASLVAIVTALVGYMGAVWLNTSTAGMMAIVVGWQFALAVALSPRYGLLAKMIRRKRLAQRIANEDVLAWLYRQHELTGASAHTLATLAHNRELMGHDVRKIVLRLEQKGLLKSTAADHFALTEQGKLAAQSIIRAHRLWEAFLEKHMQLPHDHLHTPAERMEHFVGPLLQKELAEQLHQSGIDPHGKPIPPQEPLP